MRPLTTLLLTSLSILHLLVLVHANCFHSNGTQTTAPHHAPCSNDSSHPLSTICCATQRPNPAGGLASDGFTADVCLDNGICMSQYRNTRSDVKVTVAYWREECTVKDWKSGKCLDVCVDELNLGNVPMRPCNDDPTSEKWCCGDSTACCSAPEQVVQVPRLFAHAANASSTTRSSLSVTATSSNTATIIPARDREDPSLGGGAIAGIVVGVVGGTGSLLLAAFWILKRRRSLVADPAHHGMDYKAYYAHEVDAVTPPVEVADGWDTSHELGSGERSRTHELA